MKTKTRIVSLILSAMLLLPMSSFAQDQEGTYIEEQGEIQDSLKNADVLAFGEEYNKSNTGIIVLVVAAVLVAAGGAYVMMKRKKKTVHTN